MTLNMEDSDNPDGGHSGTLSQKQGATRLLILRNRRGTRLEDWCLDWPELTGEGTNSTFSVQQHIQSLIRKDPADISAILTLPAGQDDAVWQYEHLRQICSELNGLFVVLAEECDPLICPDMKAAEWLYLCAAHPAPQSCSAIDYIVHTIDGAAALLNNSGMFPSRITIPKESTKHMQNIARRLYRIFAHTWYHHKELFVEFEMTTHLYERFLDLTTKRYPMISEKLVIIPSNIM
ncbi:hypothetical protein BASA50_009836 [Batrachochytrium salamandrivorans]|uniref:Mob1/phocein n=1 Tax=Batrachochytrium salamandrivorans TaxID=1357716 RepID=A0ABQ8F080_9FUNG|nr:hypothetical protein BASA60_011266 [Batrachochytrium salamandrivorans]KAH6568509.1 hypothetical protein BASA62_005399 [Batrachochytrium salamandrivorans]KAH6581806.1 hypothetical protein BASA61_008914 [Batrachochytrium salamandrivorans]KAH6589743.1 hypothetical protein BASA50_009836 [Batrachochytrium salamandrivorans]KAH9264899.1 hypothetical protein BASA83_011567 [Batrachochytrium salamandrivorans]